MLIHGIPITFALSLSWEEVSKIAEELIHTSPFMYFVPAILRKE